MRARAAPQAWQAAFEILVEVALDGPARDVGIGGDGVVVQAVALEPEHLHLPLNAGVGVMETVVGQVPPVFWSEGDRAHDGDSVLFPGRSPSVVYILARPPTICARPDRAEYKRRPNLRRFRSISRSRVVTSVGASVRHTGAFPNSARLVSRQPSIEG